MRKKQGVINETLNNGPLHRAERIHNKSPVWNCRVSFIPSFNGQSKGVGDRVTKTRSSNRISEMRPKTEAETKPKINRYVRTLKIDQIYEQKPDLNQI